MILQDCPATRDGGCWAPRRTPARVLHLLRHFQVGDGLFLYLTTLAKVDDLRQRIRVRNAI